MPAMKTNEFSAATDQILLADVLASATLPQMPSAPAEPLPAVVSQNSRRSTEPSSPASCSPPVAVPAQTLHPIGQDLPDDPAPPDVPMHTRDHKCRSASRSKHPERSHHAPGHAK